jgi:hypothetical protein
MQSAYHARSLRLIPKLAFTITIGLITTVAGYKAAAQDVYTLPVGFIQTPINTNAAAGTYSTFALPFQQLPNDQGLVTTVTGASNLTVACSTCATANYALATSLNYLEFETGNGVGHYYSILSNDVSGDLVLNVIPGANDLVTLGVASGDRYTIHPYWRIQDVFGTVATTPLHASNTAARADNVLVWNGGNFVVYFPNSTSGQWSPDGTDPILPDESVLIESKTVNTTNIIALGGVRSTNLVSTLDLGYNLIGNSFPAATVVSNLNLIGSGSGFQGSNTAARADNVLVWNGGNFDVLFFNTTSQQWSPSGAYPILPTSTYFVYMKHQAGQWQRPLPYTVSTTQ